MRKIIIMSTAALVGFAGNTQAGGFSNESLNSTGPLFNYKRFVIQGKAAYVKPNRDYENATGTNQIGTPVNDSSSSNAVANYKVVDGELKFAIDDHVDCMLQANEPWRLRNEVSSSFNGRFEQKKFFIDSLGLNAVCSYKTPVSDRGLVRFIGGLRTTDLEATRENSIIGAAVPGVPPALAGLEFTNKYSFESDTRALGYRLGVSYEIPSILLRAQLIYDSPIHSELSGTQKIFGNGLTIMPSTPVTTEVELPQSITARFQSGINDTTLIFAAVRWQEWGAIPGFDIRSSANPALNRTLETGWSDGWTVEGGMQKKLTEDLGLSTSVTWKQGIGGIYTDSWKFAAGVSYDLDENWRISVGGSASLLTDDHEVSNGAGAGLSSSSYDQGDDWAYAFGIRLQFAVQ